MSEKERHRDPGKEPQDLWDHQELEEAGRTLPWSLRVRGTQPCRPLDLRPLPSRLGERRLLWEGDG